MSAISDIGHIIITTAVQAVAGENAAKAVGDGLEQVGAVVTGDSSSDD